MQENTYTLADVRRMQNPINKRNKKIEIEKRNLEASIRIRAHNKIMESSRNKEIDDLKNNIKNQLSNGNIPMDAYSEIYDDRIKVFNERINALKQKKEANGGNLTAGGENQLRMYETELAKVLAEKKEFMQTREREYSEIKELEKQRLENERELKDRQTLLSAQ